MRADIDDLKISDPVVDRIAVLVMNMVSRTQFASKVLLHQVAMLMYRSSIYRDFFVGRSRRQPLTGSVTGHTAVSLLLQPRGRDREGSLAVPALDRQVSVVVGGLSLERCETVGFSQVKRALVCTGPRAKARRFTTVGSYREWGTADLAEDCVCH